MSVTWVTPAAGEMTARCPARLTFSTHREIIYLSSAAVLPATLTFSPSYAFIHSSS